MKRVEILRDEGNKGKKSEIKNLLLIFFLILWHDRKTPLVWQNGNKSVNYCGTFHIDRFCSNLVHIRKIW